LSFLEKRRRAHDDALKVFVRGAETCVASDAVSRDARRHGCVGDLLEKSRAEENIEHTDFDFGREKQVHRRNISYDANGFQSEGKSLQECIFFGGKKGQHAETWYVNISFGETAEPRGREHKKFPMSISKRARGRTFHRVSVVFGAGNFLWVAKSLQSRTEHCRMVVAILGGRRTFLFA
jgi:hypothetical protein